MQQVTNITDVFSHLRDAVLYMDPVAFAERYLNLDGHRFSLHGNGYKPFADIYRYIGVKGITPNSKPVVLVKGRQVGATTMASVLELYFMACGQFGNHGRAPMRIMHCFPQLEMAATYSKTKLNPLISQAETVEQPIPGKKIKNIIESKLDSSAQSNDSLNFKQFENGNYISIQSTGIDGNRLRGRQLCLETELPTPNGFVRLKDIKEGDSLFDENGDVCKVTKVHPINLTPEAYKITFDDGTTVDACAEHLWATFTKEERSKGNYSIKNTKEIYKTLKINDENNHSVLINLKADLQPFHRFIKSVEPIPSKPMRCITVDSPSHLYLITRSFIPTHNTVDAIFYDECQNIRGAAISNVNKLLSKAQYGVKNDGLQVYFGTPLKKGSDYWKIWQSSNQQYYHLGCEKCKEYFPLYTPGSNEWENIWFDDDLPPTDERHGFMVRCTKCGHEQDKRPAAERGKWVPLVEGDTKYVGYHINQLYMPTFDRAKIFSEKPEVHPINTERAYMNEVLGEFFSGSSAPITPEQIDEFCADHGRSYRASISASENKKVYLGCDWGLKNDLEESAYKEEDKKSQGQSYSCCVILVPDGPHILNIEYACRLPKNDPQYKKDFIDEMYRRYSVNQACGDIGFAQDLSYDLQKIHGESFLAVQATPQVNGKIKYKTDHFPHTVIFERNHYIAEVYELMKKGVIRFPYHPEHWEKVHWLVEHCCALDLKSSLDSNGEVKMRYVKTSSPCDGFFALMHAYIAYKFDITKGFQLKHPNDIDHATSGVSKNIMAVTGVVSRKF